jgi:serpin B
LVIVALSVALVASGCSDRFAGAPQVADISRTEGDVVAQGDVVDATASFAVDLYRQLAQEGENLVFSPHSIALALAMTRAGADGVTAQELDTALHLEGIADPHGGFSAVDQELSSRSGTYMRSDGTEAELKLAIADALWGQWGTKFGVSFVESLAQQYGAGVKFVDFTADAEVARVEINGWVADQTDGRIEELVPEGALEPLTRLVLTNAVYLLAPWETPFVKAGTSPGVFHLVDGSETNVDLMRLVGPLRYAAGDGWQAVELPYAGRELSMMAIVPDQGRFDEIESTLSTAQLDVIQTELTGIRVNLRFPKFEFTTQVGLLPALAALGLDEAVDPSRADFSAMTAEEKLYIGDVIHHAFIAVDEEGTEAAAATAVVMQMMSAPPPSFELTVDRPFIFQIRDATTGTVLFFGRVMDPAA